MFVESAIGIAGWAGGLKLGSGTTIASPRVQSGGQSDLGKVRSSEQGCVSDCLTECMHSGGGHHPHDLGANFTFMISYPPRGRVREHKVILAIGGITIVVSATVPLSAVAQLCLRRQITVYDDVIVISRQFRCPRYHY